MSVALFYLVDGATTLDNETVRRQTVGVLFFMPLKCANYKEIVDSKEGSLVWLR